MHFVLSFPAFLFLSLLCRFSLHLIASIRGIKIVPEQFLSQLSISNDGIFNVFSNQNREFCIPCGAILCRRRRERETDVNSQTVIKIYR